MRIRIIASLLLLCSFLKAQQITTYNKENSLLPGFPGSIVQDSSNNLWVGTGSNYYGIWTGGGLIKIDPNDEWTLYNTYNSELPDSTITSILVDSKDNKWIGTASGSVVKIDYEGHWQVWDSIHYEYLKYPIKDIAEYNNLIYFGVINFGLITYDPMLDKWDKILSLADSIVLNKLFEIESTGKQLWISNEDQLIKLTEYDTLVYNNFFGHLISGLILHLKYSDGRLHIGSSYRLPNNIISTFTILNVKSEEYESYQGQQYQIFSSSSVLENTYWVGYGFGILDPGFCITCGAGLTTPMDDSLQWFDLTFKMSNYFITDIKAVSDSIIWIGNLKELLKIDFTSPSSISVSGLHSFEAKIFPNPMTDQGMIQFNLRESGAYSLKLYDSSYRLIKVFFDDKKLHSGLQNIPISAANIPVGTYFLQLGDNKHIQTIKLVISP